MWVQVALDRMAFHLNFLLIPIFAQWIPCLILVRNDRILLPLQLLTLLLHENWNVYIIRQSQIILTECRIQVHTLSLSLLCMAPRKAHVGRTRMEMWILFLKIWRWVTSSYTAWLGGKTMRQRLSVLESASLAAFWAIVTLNMYKARVGFRLSLLEHSLSGTS